jgi:MinD-like ATPase involved in chromosome partitioning or flagellar assembly
VNTVLVTVAGPDRRQDLAVPAQTPIEQLMPTLLSVGGVEVNGDAPAWGVSRSGEPPLPPRSSLSECGVVDGTVLVVSPLGRTEEPKAPPEPEPIELEQWEKREEDRALQRRAGFPLKRTEAALPDAPGFGERLSAYLSAFFSGPDPADRQKPVVPAHTDDAPTPGPGDLTIEQPPSRRERARRSWAETSYEHRLERMVAAPRLRRCATIAVVSPKGGVGKTTMTALLGALLVKIRHERIVAVDTNPDYGSLGRALTPDHRVFVDDFIDLLDHPDLAVTELDRKLGRGFDGLMVLPAPTDPSRMARLDEDAYAKVFNRLKTMVGGLVLDCGTGLQEPAARAAIAAADQIVLVSDAEPSTASLVAEAARLLKRAGPPMYLVVNKRPKRGGRLDLEQFSRAVPDARSLLVVDADVSAASRLAAGDFSWDESPDAWRLALRELAAVMVADWADLGLAA